MVKSNNMKKFLLKIWKALPNSELLRGSLVWLITQKFLVGVVAIIFNEEQQILLFNHTYRHKYPWGLPSGWLKRGELASMAIKREILEETGISIEVLRPIIVEGDDQWPRVDLVFLCRIMTGEFSPSDEVGAVQFFDVDALPEILPAQKRVIKKAFDENYNPQLILSG